ncbi:FBD-associated F-box protein At4g13985-like [Carex rostrata]
MDGTDLAIDSISDMPNELLTRILSLLTTEEAVRTSILSKRWTYLWTSMDTLDFDFGSCMFGDFYHENRFPRFIDGVLNHRGFSSLDKFKLTWQSDLTRSDYGNVEECISYEVTRMPRFIDIYIGTNLIFKLPDSLLNCGSIKEMSLLADSLFESKPKSINLPSLQKMEIGHTSIDDDLIKMFLLGCPVLEELALTSCRLMFKEINSNVLKKLTIKKCSLRTTSFTLKNASSLVTADLDIEIPYYKGELNLLGSLPNVTSLRLNASRNVLILLNKDIPNCLILNNLKSLELGGLETRSDWDLLVCFLQHAPNLKKLVLSFGQSLCNMHYWGKKSFAREFLEIVEIRFVERSFNKKIEKTVVKIMGDLVKTIGNIVTL